MIKVSFSTLGCPNWKFNEILAGAKDLGYDGIEIRGIERELFAPNILEFKDENLVATMERLRKLNIEIPIFTSGSNLASKDNISTTLEECRAYVDLASKAKVKYIRVLTDLNPKEETEVDVNFVSENLKKICLYAKNKNVTVLIETNGFFAKSENILNLINLVAMDNLGVIWDIHHPYRFKGESPEYTFSALKNYIKHVHIKDSKIIDGEIKYQLLGYGDIPFKKAIELLKQNGYDGYLSLEWVKRWAKGLAEPGIVFPHYIYEVRSMLKK